MKVDAKTNGQSEHVEKEELEKGPQCLVAQIPAQLSGRLLWVEFAHNSPLCFHRCLPLRVHLWLQTVALIAGSRCSVRRGVDTMVSLGLGSSRLQTATGGQQG